jgi:hypothetical protein
VVACKRIIRRHPLCGPLWWLGSRVLTSVDPVAELRAVEADMENDRTAIELAAALPDGATVCVLGWPDLIGEAIDRRGDVRVLAIDVADLGSSFSRQLQRRGVDADEVDAADLSAAVRDADFVLVEVLIAAGSEALAERLSYAAAAAAYCAEIPVWAVAGVGRCVPNNVMAALHERGHDGESVPAGLFTDIVGTGGRSGPLETFDAECGFAPELLRMSVL